MSQPSLRAFTSTVATLGLLLIHQYAVPVSAAAQEPDALVPARLQGVVVLETTGQAVEAATVTVLGTDLQTQTGRFGDFAFPDAETGVISVRVAAPGYPSVVQEVDLTGDRIVFIQFRLPAMAAVLAELLVEVSHEAPDVGPATAADLLAIEVPSSRIVSGNVGKNDYLIQLRRSSGSLTQNAEPLILIDGVMISRLGQAMDALSQIPASDVESIEVLMGPVSTVRYPMAANGVVLVKTRSGR
jgi:hypothetical protein